MGPCLALINMPSVKGHKAWRNFLELRHGEVRTMILPRTLVKVKKKGQGTVGPRPSGN